MAYIASSARSVIERILSVVDKSANMGRIDSQTSASLYCFVGLKAETGMANS